MYLPHVRKAAVTAGLLCAVTTAAMTATAVSASATPRPPASTRTPAKAPAKTPAALTVSIKASGPAKARAPFEETLSGVVSRASSPLGGQVVALERRAARTGPWTTASERRTAPATGAVTFRVKQPRPTQEYRLVVIGAHGRAVAQSAVVTVKGA